MRITALACLMLATGCNACILLVPDTCSDGATVTNPRVAPAVEFEENQPFLRVSWGPGTGRGAELPDAYYRAARVDTNNADGRSTRPDVLASSQRLIFPSAREALAYLQPLDQLLEEEADRFAFEIVWPQRSQYIGCIGDAGFVYRLGVEFTLHPAGAVTDATLWDDVWVPPL